MPKHPKPKAAKKPQKKGKAPEMAEAAERRVAAKPPKAKRAKVLPVDKAGKPKAKLAKAGAGKAKLKTPTWKKAGAAPLPVPEALALPVQSARAPKPVRRAETRHLARLDADVPTGPCEAAVLDRLWATIEERRLNGDVQTSHSARLLSRGTAKVAQKLGEEAVECVIEAMAGNRSAIISESADLLYHLLVLWVDAGIRPEEAWAELVRREGLSGIAEKASRQSLSPHGIVRAAGTTKLP
ncbi:phosphoribosyl-ATP diphosphatase [Muricoccus radiodurans]|uniref:phosphoribosyl-ATP diphosphatase n=1 Tax=Muricoccus radiodurans TaxID=2231721 RepID=UPI003CF89535